MSVMTSVLLRMNPKVTWKLDDLVGSGTSYRGMIVTAPMISSSKYLESPIGMPVIRFSTNGQLNFVFQLKMMAWET